MNRLTRTTALTLLATFTVLGLPSPSLAAKPTPYLLPPQHEFLPKFGFSSFNIHGYGERITHVHWGGLAAQMGLEPGDMILSLNDFPLRYHGAWNDALHQAMAQGGWVRLRIRDVRTGRIAHRQIYLGGGIGPVTPKTHVVGYPAGPITAKSVVAPHGHHHATPHGVHVSLKDIVNLFSGKKKP